jgi:hypothetical protein
MTPLRPLPPSLIGHARFFQEPNRQALSCFLLHLLRKRCPEAFQEPGNEHSKGIFLCPAELSIEEWMEAGKGRREAEIQRVEAFREALGDEHYFKILAQLGVYPEQGPSQEEENPISFQIADLEETSHNSPPPLSSMAGKEVENHDPSTVG